jgi:hypothetical protein
VAQKRGPKKKTYPLQVAQDPKLWRYDSLADALADNVELLARAIRAGEHAPAHLSDDPEPAEPVVLSEGA